MKTWAPSIFDCIGIVLFIGLLLGGAPTGGDPGVFWHLLTGSWIIDNGSVPYQDPFLHSQAPQPWVADQWLSDLILYRVFDLGGWPLLHVLTIGVAVGVYTLLTTLALRKETNSFLLQSFLTLMVAMLGGVQWFTRPVIFAFALFALVYFLIWSYSRSPVLQGPEAKRLWLLPPIFLLWANMHPAFPLGFAVCGLFGCQALISCRPNHRAMVFYRLCIVGLLCAGATLLTPYGLGLYVHILELVQDPYFMSLNTEWKSPDFQHIAFRPFWCVLGLLIVLPALVGRGKTTAMDWIALGLFVGYSLLHRRYIPFTGILAAVPLACLFEAARLQLQTSGLLPGIARLFGAPAWKGSHGLLFFVVFGLTWAYTFTSGHIPGHDSARSGPHPEYPWKALAHVKSLLPERAAIPAKVFATPNWGGAISWSLWPDARPFIDDRNNLNGRQRYEDFFMLNKFGSEWQGVLKKHHFDVLILESESAAANALPLTRKWAVRYRDAKTVVFMPK